MDGTVFVYELSLQASFAITITTIENRLLRIDSVFIAKRDAAPSAALVCRPLVVFHGRYIRGTFCQQCRGHVCLRADNTLVGTFHFASSFQIDLVVGCGNFTGSSPQHWSKTLERCVATSGIHKSPSKKNEWFGLMLRYSHRSNLSNIIRNMFFAVASNFIEWLNSSFLSRWNNFP